MTKSHLTYTRLVITIYTVAFCGWLLFYVAPLKCNQAKLQPTTITKIDTIYLRDTNTTNVVSKPNNVNHPKLVAVDSSRLNYQQPSQFIIDSIEVAKAYLSNAYYYVQTINDGIHKAIIEDSIYQNSITWRKVNISRETPLPVTIITQHTKEPCYPKKTNIYLVNDFTTLGLINPGITITHKRILYKAGYFGHSKQVYLGIGLQLF